MNSALAVQPYYYETASSCSLQNQEVGNQNHIEEKLQENLKTMGPGLRDSCSDTDSGICADSSSDTQLSPKQLAPPTKSQLLLIPKGQVPAPLPRPQGFKPLPNIPLHNLPQGINSHQWRQRKNLQQSRSFCQNSGFLSSDSSSGSSPASSQKKAAPLRVRFADEVPVPQPSAKNSQSVNINEQNSLAKNGAQLSSGNINSVGPKNGASQSNPAYYYCMGQNGQRPSGQEGFSTTVRHFRQDYEIQPEEQSKSPDFPAPPPYLAAVERLHEIKQRQNFFADSRNRSASLPRNCGARSRDRDRNDPGGIPIKVDRNYVQNMRQRATDIVLHGSGLTPAKSMDNLHLQQARRQNGCVMPANSCSDIVTLSSQQGVVVPPPANRFRVQRPEKPQHAHHAPGFAQYVRRFATNALHKFGSDEQLGRPPRMARSLPPQPHGHGHHPANLNANLADRKLKIRLLGLDCYGIQTLEIEKLEPGPFGFYIATGMFKRKKGIFISRVNARCLAQLISIGDQLLEVDAVSTKGKSLEQVQALIANKQKIVLKILPVIMR